MALAYIHDIRAAGSNEYHDLSLQGSLAENNLIFDIVGYLPVRRPVAR
jgi:hypothetical protein